MQGWQWLTVADSTSTVCAARSIASAPVCVVCVVLHTGSWGPTASCHAMHWQRLTNQHRHHLAPTTSTASTRLISSVALVEVCRHSALLQGYYCLSLKLTIKAGTGRLDGSIPVPPSDLHRTTEVGLVGKQQVLGICLLAGWGSCLCVSGWCNSMCKSVIEKVCLQQAVCAILC